MREKTAFSRSEVSSTTVADAAQKENQVDEFKRESRSRENEKDYRKKRKTKISSDHSASSTVPANRAQRTRLRAMFDEQRFSGRDT